MMISIISWKVSIHREQKKVKKAQYIVFFQRHIAKLFIKVEVDIQEYPSVSV